MLRPSQTPAEAAQEYAKAALILIVRCRYAAFTKTFGREPGPHDPLFFDESVGHPVKADLPTTHRQLSEGALAAGVKLAPVLLFQGLTPLPDHQAGLTSETRRAEQRSGRKIWTSRRPESDSLSILTKFLSDDHLHRRHRITARNCSVSQESRLGAVTSAGDIRRFEPDRRHSNA